ncbi:hypothetical protein Hdeb2414_s0008g00272061 [Helianthus debilis subsp. tardiflorus]
MAHQQNPKSIYTQSFLLTLFNRIHQGIMTLFKIRLTMHSRMENLNPNLHGEYIRWSRACTLWFC